MTMQASQQLKQRIDAELRTLKILKPKGILLAVSGGVDSMVLLHLVATYFKDNLDKVGVFHLDHMYRGQAAIEDAKLVTTYASSLGLRVHAYRRPVEALAKKESRGFEDIARRIRYQLINTLMQAEAYDYVLTAHHKEDLVETILMNIFRGTSLEGLKGIAKQNGPLVRPLLEEVKATLYAYAHEHMVPYNEDMSNEDSTFTRNKVRNHLIPFVNQTFNVDLVDRIAKLSGLVTQDLEVIDHWIDGRYKDLVDGDASMLRLNADAYLALMQGERFRLVRRMIQSLKGNLQDVEFKHIKTLDQWVCQGTKGSRQALWNLYFEHRGQEILVTKQPNNPQIQAKATYTLAYGDQVFEEWGLSVECRAIKEALPCEDHTLVIDADVFDQGLVIRGREPGDGIKLLGMKGHTKKIKKLLSELNLSHAQKDKLIFIAQDTNVIWLVGVKKSAYDKKPAETGDFVQISVSKL